MTIAFVIDDNRQTADSMCDMLKLLGIEAYPVYGSRTAMLALARKTPDVIFMDINPGIVKIKTDLHSDTGITILANSITLTPGTLTLDVNKKLGETYLYVHWIDVETLNREKAGEKIKGDIEEWLKKAFW